jgi:hypothetical protein
LGFLARDTAPLSAPGTNAVWKHKALNHLAGELASQLGEP